MPVSIFWFRRDLRLENNAGLYYALKSGHPVLPVFIYDTNILDDLEDKKDKRVCFIRDSLQKIKQELEEIGSTLYVLYGTPIDAFKKLLGEFDVHSVFTNEDYEPYAAQRDKEIEALLKKENVSFNAFKDHVVFAKNEVLKKDNTPYTVFTPYSKTWKEKLEDSYLKSCPTRKYYSNFLKHTPKRFPSLESIGFEQVDYEVTEPKLDKSIVKDYHKTRDLPGMEGTTKLSVHLRFGTVSIRKVVHEAMNLNETLLSEFIWRDFFQSILWHFPNTVTESFKPAYDNIKWRYAEKEFEAWCQGETGYPIVDAGMRQLNETGWMHNRIRMVTASFLCKHLLIDWRWGEAYFAKKLLDYDMAQNIGNWQWVAGSGVDAAPYFRIFNPYIQQKKFDPDNAYIDHWVPERNSSDYPKPIVEHEFARARCLEVYKEGLGRK